MAAGALLPRLAPRALGDPVQSRVGKLSLVSALVFPALLSLVSALVFSSALSFVFATPFPALRSLLLPPLSLGGRKSLVRVQRE